MTTAIYWPAADDEQILRISDRHPCKAEVSGRCEDGRFDLVVTDHLGSIHFRRSVAEGRCREPDRCVLLYAP